MHIPDGFINVPTVVVTSAVSAGAIAYGVSRANRRLGEKHVPLMGVMAAFIFAAQMLNFPVAGGTSGHVLGAALAAILLGPWVGVLIMACVFIVQCLIFQDGGLTALGANILNMGIIACFVGYYLYQGVVSFWGERRRSQLVAAFLGAWLSIVAAAAATAIELAVSGTSPLAVALPAMAGVHVLIGIGEGLVTAAVISLVMTTRADLLQLERV